MGFCDFIYFWVWITKNYQKSEDKIFNENFTLASFIFDVCIDDDFIANSIDLL